MRLALVLSLALAAPALAQEASEEARAAAERYIRSDAMQTMLDEMISPEAMSQAVVAQFGDTLTPEQVDEIVAVSVEEVQSIQPAMEEAMIEAAARTFTVEEIEAQIEFYDSEVGASIMSKTQPFMTAFYEAIGPEMQAMNQRLMERAAEMPGSE